EYAHGQANRARSAPEYISRGPRSPLARGNGELPLPKPARSAILAAKPLESGECRLMNRPSISGQFGKRLGKSFEVADCLSAEREWNAGADQDHDDHRAKEDRRRSSVRNHHKRYDNPGEDARERFAEKVPASTQRRRELLG